MKCGAILNIIWKDRLEKRSIFGRGWDACYQPILPIYYIVTYIIFLLF